MQYSSVYFRLASEKGEQCKQHRPVKSPNTVCFLDNQRPHVNVWNRKKAYILNSLLFLPAETVDYCIVIKVAQTTFNLCVRWFRSRLLKWQPLQQHHFINLIEASDWCRELCAWPSPDFTATPVPIGPTHANSKGERCRISFCLGQPTQYNFL